MRWRPDGVMKAAVLLASIVVDVGCARSGDQNAGNGEASDPLAEAPQEWAAFLDWAETELATIPPAAPFPKEPRMAEPKWAVIRLDEMLDKAVVQCDWKPPSEQREPLAKIGPFRWTPPAEPAESENQDGKPESKAWLEMEGFQVQREDVGSVSIEIRQPIGSFFELSWSVAGIIRVPVPDNEKLWTLTIRTDGLADWTGPLETIKFRSGGTGEGAPEIRAIRFMPREASFPQAVGSARVRLDREIRTAVYAHPPATIRFEGLRIPNRGKLQVGLGQVLPTIPKAGANQPTPDRAAQPMTFNVSVEHDENTTAVLSQEVTGTAGWADASASLATWSGKTINLVFETKGASSEAVACWANPIVYEPVDNPPCVMIYLIDTLGSNHCNLYGYARSTMPKLAEIARGGVWFSQALANSSRTLESVPDLMLSMSTDRHAVSSTSARAADEFVTLAETLRAAGFATVSFCTNVNAGPRQNMDQGFDHFFDDIAYSWWQPVDRTVPIEDVTAWMRTHADRPTFVYVHTAEPHAPYVPPAEFAGRFYPGYTGKIDGTLDKDRGFFRAETARDVAHVVALYDEEVAYADARLAKLIDSLQEAGLYENVQLFVTSDHGEEFLEHGWWQHENNLHGELVRIPLVAAGAMVTRRGKEETPVQLYDVMPTILAMFDVPAPYPLEGESLLPLLQETENDSETDALQKRAIVASNHFHKARDSEEGVVEYAIVANGKLKLMYRFAQGPGRPLRGAERFALFDLDRDLPERTNQIDAHRDQARELIGRLIAWRRRQAPFDGQEANAERLLDGNQLRDLRNLGYVE